MSLKPLRSALVLIVGLAGVAVTAAPAPSAMAITASDAPVHIALAVPLVTPAGTTGLIDAEALAQYTSPAGLLSRQLDAVIDRQVAIGIDPMIIASVRALGAAAPPSAVQWLERLRDAPNETFALAYGDSDLALELQAGAATALQPIEFDFALDAEQFSDPTTPTPTPTGSPSPTPTPTETPAPGQPPLPTTEALLEWPYTMDAIAWPVESTMTAADLPKLTASGYETTVLSSNNVSTRDSLGPTAEIGDNHVIVTDDVVSGLVREASLALNDESWTAALAQLSATLGTISSISGGDVTTVFATVGRGTPPNGFRLAETIDAIEALPSVSLISMSTAVDIDAVDATIVDKPIAPEQVAQFTAVLDAETAETQFSSILTDPPALTAERRLHVLALASNAWSSNPIGWQSRTNDYLVESAEIRSDVQVVESSTINLVADRQSLQISVSNDLPYEVTVNITVRPETGLLRVENLSVPVTVAPNSQGKGAVPVQSISNGIVDASVSLTSPTGVPIGVPQTVEVNVQAGWETPITIAIAVVVILVFGFGILRNILRRRKARRE